MGHVHAREASAQPSLGAAGSAASLDARRADSRRRMWIALGLNLAMLAAELVGGLLTGSLALLADAGHVLSDVGAIAIGLIAGGLAARPSKARRTFGYQRSEVLAALINGVALLAVAILVIVAALDRLEDPPEIEGVGVLVLGGGGLLGNLAATWVLAGGQRADINLEAVLRHSVADALGSLGVIAAGAVVLATGWREADPVASLLIALLILASCWRLIREPVDVLMEAAPPSIDVDELAREICAAPGVGAVHDLHVWTVTSGFEALSAHVVARHGADRDRLRQELEVVLADRYGIRHTTLQMEEEAEGGLLQVEGADELG